MPRGGFGGFRGGFGGFRGGFGGRRIGGPLIMGGGGYGMGGGLGSPLLTSLLAGGVGYALGSSNAQNAPQGQGQPVYPAAPPYYPVPLAPQQAPVSGADTGRLAQLHLLGELHDSGVLTDDEFEREKRRVLGG